MEYTEKSLGHPVCCPLLFHFGINQLSEKIIQVADNIKANRPRWTDRQTAGRIDGLLKPCTLKAATQVPHSMQVQHNRTHNMECCKGAALWSSDAGRTEDLYTVPCNQSDHVALRHMVAATLCLGIMLP